MIQFQFIYCTGTIILRVRPRFLIKTKLGIALGKVVSSLQTIAFQAAFFSDRGSYRRQAYGTASESPQTCTPLNSDTLKGNTVVLPAPMKETAILSMKRGPLQDMGRVSHTFACSPSPNITSEIFSDLRTHR